ncbi:pectate lyase superfamily protein domain-containing protein [Penicillium macrosclerotiorum]|uniref:pectate lyase superfamily protein domain-containing protein n=1 Tax=Penicillium macrosclerotiorum TaxID=303699 RepID=UPI002546CC3C|nr:pectate lyase superfamily protein domain-containing protein [Penicillium macrosclerotiorum]KAJ5673913.1 pectate lyase superfamily protein domain-containing protein [Penicillium macrosclerotiorum]
MSSSIMRGYFDVQEYGATGLGKANDSPAIQSAINAAAAAGGGIVWFPPGLYLIDKRTDTGLDATRGLTIDTSVILAGAGTGKPQFNDNPLGSPLATNGSKLMVTNRDITPIFVTGWGTIIRDMAIYHEQPEPVDDQPWKPDPYPATILVAAHDVCLENLFLRNPTVGIVSENAGRLSISRLFGQPLQTGISIDNARDRVKIDKVHFWPFWNGATPVKKYIFDNAHAIESYRNDNPVFSNIFTLGYSTGFLFSKRDNTPQGDITSKFQITNADNDYGYQGIKIDGPLTTGHIVNYNFQGDKGSETGINIQAPGVIVQATNVRIKITETNSIRASGAGARLNLDNVWIQSWNKSGIGFPGIEAVDSDTVISVGFNLHFTEGEGRLTGGNGVIARATPVVNN